VDEPRGGEGVFQFPKVVTCIHYMTTEVDALSAITLLNNRLCTSLEERCSVDSLVDDKGNLRDYWLLLRIPLSVQTRSLGPQLASNEFSRSIDDGFV
jgi:hypothetical protein